MTKEIIIIVLIICLICYYYQHNNQPHIAVDKASYDNLIKDLKKQVQHYQTLYQKRVEKDLSLEKKEAGNQTDNPGTWTDLTDRQITLLRQQWEQVAEWATEQGIDVNKKWNLGLLKGLLEQKVKNLEEEKTNLIKSNQKELLIQVAELRKKQEQIEQLYKEQLAAKEKEHEENEKRWKKAREEKKELNNDWLKKKGKWETEKKGLIQELQTKNNWGNDNIPDLKRELFDYFDNTYQELKTIIDQAKYLWGENILTDQIVEKIKRLDELFYSCHSYKK